MQCDIIGYVGHIIPLRLPPGESLKNLARGACHSERSEESRSLDREILRFAQNDKGRRMTGVNDILPGRIPMQTINTSTSQPTDRTQLIRELSAMLAQLSLLQSLTRPHATRSLSQPEMAILRDGLAALEQMAREMLYEARSADDALLLESLPDVPLAEALARAVDETAEAMQLSSRVVFSGEERPLSGESGRMLYHIALAALSQVRQHSGARKLRFTFHYENDEILMSIEDDGVPVATPLVGVPSVFAD